MLTILPEDKAKAVLVGRVWLPQEQGPALCVVRDEGLYDISCRATPTMSDLLALDNPVAFVHQQTGQYLGSVADIAKQSLTHQANPAHLHLLAPCDLQAVKACGVTFARSMLERVIEEAAAGDPQKAQHIRTKVSAVIGDSLRQLTPGSEQAAQLKAALQAEGMWSQYLEVGIGPDAEVFTKAQPLSAVGWGAEVGIHPISQWNNPEPEIVLAVNHQGIIQGATLGNDVNLRDVEGRSALLLGKAKDNNAACAIGPFIRLFDAHFGLDHIRQAELSLRIEGEDHFVLEGFSTMREISRDPNDLVQQTMGQHHQYPDGFMLFCGTLFAPVQDRDQEGQGFTHHLGDNVSIYSAALGTLVNTVRHTHQCPPWQFGVSALMRNLAKRQLLN